MFVRAWLVVVVQYCVCDAAAYMYVIIAPNEDTVCLYYYYNIMYEHTSSRHRVPPPATARTQVVVSLSQCEHVFFIVRKKPPLFSRIQSRNTLLFSQPTPIRRILELCCVRVFRDAGVDLEVL